MTEAFDVYYVPNIDEIDHDEAVGIALQWLQASVAKRGGIPLVIAPTQEQLRYPYLAPKLARARVRAESLRTAQRRIFPGGPVLLLWPSKHTLALIEGWSNRITALCIVQGALEDETDAWLRGRDAQNLLRPDDRKTVPALDPVIEQALESVTNFVNLRNNLVTTDDKAVAYRTLHCLYSSGYRLDPEAIHAWAVAHRWPTRGAQRLRDLSQDVVDGKRVRAQSDVGLARAQDCAEAVAFWKERSREKAT